MTYDGGAAAENNTLAGTDAGLAWAVSNLATYGGTLATGSDNVSFTNVQSFVAGSGPDTLTGDGGTRLWDLDTDPTFGDGTDTISFSGMETLQGAGGADTFTLSADAAYAILGGPGSDAFVFVGSTLLTGGVDGQGGSDTLDDTGYGSAYVTVLGSGATGYTPTELFSITGGNATGIDAVLAPVASTGDFLQGENTTSTWTVAATSMYNDGNSTLTFADFDFLFGGTAVDTFNESVGLSGRVLTLDGGGAGDVYNVTFGTLGAGGAETQIIDSGPGGSDVGNMIGTAADDTLDVNAAANPGYVTSPAGERVRYVGGGLEAMTLDGRGGTNTYNLYYGGLVNPTSVTPTAGGADTANLYGTGGADTFDVNASTPQAVFLGGERVNYTAGLENLFVNGPATQDVNPQAPLVADTGDTFSVKPDPVTTITINGGLPVNGTGDTLLLNVAGEVNPTLRVPSRPNGSVTWSGPGRTGRRCSGTRSRRCRSPSASAASSTSRRTARTSRPGTTASSRGRRTTRCRATRGRRRRRGATPAGRWRRRRRRPRTCRTCGATGWTGSPG